ncbi:MAG: cation transporter [Selenomonadaceae bacterium]|nr:cation transporter [Selenomonadaceae bacterium]
MKKVFKFNADCANCANEMELVAKNTEGIKNAVANFMTLKMTIEFEDGQDYKSIMKNVRDKCRKIDDECEIFL